MVAHNRVSIWEKFPIWEKFQIGKDSQIGKSFPKLGILRLKLGKDIPKLSREIIQIIQIIQNITGAPAAQWKKFFLPEISFSLLTL